MRKVMYSYVHEHKPISIQLVQFALTKLNHRIGGPIAVGHWTGLFSPKILLCEVTFVVAVKSTEPTELFFHRRRIVLHHLRHRLIQVLLDLLRILAGA